MIAEEYGALCEAMYLVMAADGIIGGEERDVIRGALRELDDRIRSRHIDAMLGAVAEALAREGWEARFRAVGDSIREDPVRAETALLLAAAVTYADGQVAPQESDVMYGLMTALGVTEARVIELVSSLERVGIAMERDPDIDPADIVAHAAMRLRMPEDFERLAATTDRPDVRLALRLYAAYVRSGDDMLDRSAATPRSIPTARVAALHTLVALLPEGRSNRLNDLRTALSRFVKALERIDRATALRTLLDDGGDMPPIVEVVLAATRLSQFVGRSLVRGGETVATTAAPGDLRQTVEDALRDIPDGRGSLGAAVDRTLAWAASTLPGALVATFDVVLRRILSLPIDRPSATPPAEEADPALPEWIPGNRVLGGFSVLKPLGVGGTASVFVVGRAEERGDPHAQHFALKVPQYDALAASSISESEFLSMFRKEAGALLSLPEHPNLAGFVTFDARARPKPFLVMELVHGASCHDVVERRQLDATRAVAILEGILDGLAAIHAAGLGHLDIKPSNVVLRRGGEPVLVDFGLAGRELRMGCATPAYAPPEVWGHSTAGVPATPFAADVYSFGCLAYELLAGRPLFAGPNALAIMAAHVSHDGGPEPIQRMLVDPLLGQIGALLGSCLRRSPAERPTVSTLREKLRALTPHIATLGWPIV